MQFTANPGEGVIQITQQKPDPATEPKAETEEVKPAAPTKEEIDSHLKNVMESLGYADKPKTETAKTEEPAKTEPKVETPAAKPPEAKPTEEKPKAKRIRSDDELADKVAKRVGDAIDNRIPKEPAPAAVEAPPADNSDADDAYKREVLSVMAEKKPEYKGKLAEFDAFLAKEKAYKEKWSKSNPGKAFDPDDDQHSEFYTDSEPEVDDAAFIRAEALLEARKETHKTIQEERIRTATVEARKQVEAALPEVKKAATKDLIVELGEEFKDVGELKSLREKDPMAARAVKAVASQMETMLEDAQRMLTPGTQFQVDPNNKDHQKLLQAVYNYESTLASADDLPLNAGRKFATIENWLAMKPAEQTKHWTIWTEPEVVRPFIVRDFGELARKEYLSLKEDFGAISTRSTQSSSAAATNGHESTSPAAYAQIAARSAPPNMASGADAVTPGGGPTQPQSDFAKSVASVLWQ